MISSRTALAVLVLTMGVSTAVIAGDDLVGDRPDFTESAVTIAPGRLQIEAGFTGASAGDTDILDIGEVLLRFGLDNGFEFRVGLGGWLDIDAGPGDVDGFTDIEFALKRHLLAGDGATPEVAVIFGTSIPTGNEDVTADTVQPLGIVAAEWTLSDRLGLGTNLGWSSVYDGDRFLTLWMSAALGYALNERLGVFVEGYGFNKESPDGDATTYGDVGFTYLVDDDLQFDIRYGTGFGDVDETYAGVGMVLRI